MAPTPPQTYVRPIYPPSLTHIPITPSASFAAPSTVPQSLIRNIDGELATVGA
jgi:hypothetical protein